LTTRALQLLIALEVVWAAFLGYEVHDVFVGPGHARASFVWDLQLQNFMHDWALPAIAIVVVVWFADLAVSQSRT
jgi:signal recognition particle receptor subunit beta